MVELLAKQSIDRKIEINRSIMIGNYEFYYACGLLAGKVTFAGDATTQPLAMKEEVTLALESFQPKDAREEYLVKLLRRYQPDEAYDSQMADLFQWGLTGREPEQ